MANPAHLHLIIQFHGVRPGSNTRVVYGRMVKKEKIVIKISQ